jgi:hypothetical protein
VLQAEKAAGWPGPAYQIHCHVLFLSEVTRRTVYVLVAWARVTEASANPNDWFIIKG